MLGKSSTVWTSLLWVPLMRGLIFHRQMCAEYSWFGSCSLLSSSATIFPKFTPFASVLIKLANWGGDHIALFLWPQLEVEWPYQTSFGGLVLACVCITRLTIDFQTK